MLTVNAHIHVTNLMDSMKSSREYRFPAQRLVLHTRTVKDKKVKSTIPYEECWWGAHLPYLGLNHLSL